MSSTYSTNLAIELIGTGDQAGAWGNTTNTNLGTLIEQAISGYVTQAVSTGGTTAITIPNGSTGVARNMFIELTGTGGASTFLEVPSNKKLYFIYNNTNGAVTVRVSGQTGVSVAAGEKKILVSNGTDVVEATTYIVSGGSANLTTLTATSANITTLTGTTFGDTGTTNLRGVSGNITTLTGSVFGAVASTQLRGASGVITTLTGTTSTYTDVRGTSGNITTLTGTTVTYASGTIGQFAATSANITTLTGTTATYSDVRGTSANITTLTGTNFSATSLTLTNALKIGQGGTGLSSTPTNGQLLIGNGSGYTLATLTAGSNISITNGAGSVSIAATTSTGDITFTSALISTANTNQNMILDPNGTGKVLVNTSSELGVYGPNTAFQVLGATSTNLYPALIESQQYGRASLILWNNHSSGRGSNNAQFVWFSLDATEDFVGSITYDNSAGQIKYNATSDRRVKTIYGPTTNSGALIDGLKVYDGKMNLGTLTYPMMIADEVQQVTPYCVTGQPNAVDENGKPVYQQVDYTSLVPLLIAEIQSLRARVAALEAAP